MGWGLVVTIRNGSLVGTPGLDPIKPVRRFRSFVPHGSELQAFEASEVRGKAYVGERKVASRELRLLAEGFLHVGQEAFKAFERTHKKS